MPRPSNSYAEEPLYAAIVGLVARGGMPAVTIRAAAQAARCSVGFMQHYYRSKSLMLACAHGLVEHELVTAAGIEASSAASRARERGVATMDPRSAATLLTSVLLIAEGEGGVESQRVPGGTFHRAHLHFWAMALHDATVAESMASHHRSMRRLVRDVLTALGLSAEQCLQAEPELTCLVTGAHLMVLPLADERQTRPWDPDDARETICDLLEQRLTRWAPDQPAPSKR